MLWMVKRVFWGPANAREDSGTAHLHEDLNPREIAVMLPIVVLIFWMGVHPQTFLGQSEAPGGPAADPGRPPAQASGLQAREVKP